MRNAAGMGFQIGVGHGVERQGNVETEVAGMAGSGFDAHAGGDADDHHLGDALALQPGFEIGLDESACRALRHRVVPRVWLQIGDEIRPTGGKFPDAGRLVRPAGRHPGDIDEHDRQAMGAKCLGQGCCPFQHIFNGMGRRQRDDAFLQVDDDQRRLMVERGDCH